MGRTTKKSTAVIPPASVEEANQQAATGAEERTITVHVRYTLRLGDYESVELEGWQKESIAPGTSVEERITLHEELQDGLRNSLMLAAVQARHEYLEVMRNMAANSPELYGNGTEAFQPVTRPATQPPAKASAPRASSTTTTTKPTPRPATQNQQPPKDEIRLQPGFNGVLEDPIKVGNLAQDAEWIWVFNEWRLDPKGDGTVEFFNDHAYNSKFPLYKVGAGSKSLGRAFQGRIPASPERTRFTRPVAVLMRTGKDDKGKLFMFMDSAHSFDEGTNPEPLFIAQDDYTQIDGDNAAGEDYPF